MWRVQDLTACHLLGINSFLMLGSLKTAIAIKAALTSAT